jgi:hypothetical protein
MAQTSTLAQLRKLMDDELEALEHAIAMEKERRWRLRRTPTLVEDLREGLWREGPGSA